MSIKNVSKSYGKVQALNNINLEIAHGELFGLIGPDGAGKTTLFRILATLLLPNTGSVSICDLDAVADYKKIRNLLGYMPGKFSLYQDLSVMENLNFFATVFDTKIEDNMDMIHDIWEQIKPFKDRIAGKLSGGMKQKLALCCALIHKPKILLLDEPTTGVDAVSRNEFWVMLKSLKEKGVTIVVATPYMDEANMCDRVALIQNGNVLQLDSPKGIVSNFERKLFDIKGEDIYQLMLDIREFKHTNSIFPFGQSLHYTDIRDDFDIIELNKFLEDRGHKNVNIKITEPGIEDCFMALSKETSHENEF